MWQQGAMARRSQTPLVAASWVLLGFCSIICILFFFPVARLWLHWLRGEACGISSGGSGKYFASLVVLGFVLLLWQRMKAAERRQLGAGLSFPSSAWPRAARENTSEPPASPGPL